MKKIGKLFFFVLCFLSSATLLSQVVIEAGNKIKLYIKMELKSVDSTCVFNYSIANQPLAEQELIEFSVITSVNVRILHTNSPVGWNNAVFDEGETKIRWFAEAKDDGPGYINAVKPGSDITGMMLQSIALPGIIVYYAEGAHPLPSFPEGMATDSIPGYTDLTPYGPGIVGTTVGPVMPSFVFVASGFIDTLVSYKHQALALKWIDNEGIANSLDQKLENAKQQLVRGDSASCKNILKAFVNEVEAQKDKHLTSEAYALLKFNAEYLIDRLPDDKKK